MQVSYPQIYFACHTRHVRRASTPTRLSATDSTLLAHLDEKMAVRPTALAKHLGLAASTMSAAVARLTDLGYIAREKHAVDGRVVDLRALAQRRGRDASQLGAGYATRPPRPCTPQAGGAQARTQWAVAARARRSPGAGGPGMKWVYGILGALILVALVVAIVGWLLPVKHEASRAVELARTPNEVYALASDYRNYAAWWPDISRIEVLVEEPGRATFREHLADGPIVMSVMEQSAPSRFVTKIDDASQPFGGTWTFEVVPASEGRTRLTITERGEIYNPIFRALARFVFGYTATMESFLAAAQRALVDK